MKVPLRIYQIELNQWYSTELFGEGEADANVSVPYLYEPGLRFMRHGFYVSYSDSLPDTVPGGHLLLICVGQKVPQVWKQSGHEILLVHGSDSLLTVFNHVQDIFRSYDEWNETLYTELSHENSFSMRNFVEKGLVPLRHPFYVMDSSLRIVFSSTDQKNEEGTEVFSVSDQKFPQGYPCDKNMDKSADMERGIQTPYFSQQIWNGCRMYCYNIYAMGHFACCCFFIEEPGNPLNERDLFLANNFFRSFRKVYLKNLKNSNDEHTVVSKALYHMLANRPLSHEEYEQLSLEEGEEWVLFRLKKSRNVRALPAEVMVAMLNLALPPHIFATVYNGQIIGLIRHKNQNQIDQQIQTCFLGLLREMGYIAALSNAMTEMVHTDIYYQQAAFLCDECIDVTAPVLIYHFKDYVMKYILKVCTDVIPKESLFTSDVKRLIDYEKRTRINLLETLNHYFDNRCNVTLTAQMLYLHRTSLVKRLARAEQLLNHSLEDPDYRLYLWICLKALEQSKV